MDPGWTEEKAHWPHVWEQRPHSPCWDRPVLSRGASASVSGVSAQSMLLSPCLHLSASVAVPGSISPSLSLFASISLFLPLCHSLCHGLCPGFCLCPFFFFFYLWSVSMPLTSLSLPLGLSLIVSPYLCLHLCLCLHLLPSHTCSNTQRHTHFYLG